MLSIIIEKAVETKHMYNILNYIVNINDTFCIKILFSEMKFAQMVLGLYWKYFRHDNNKFLALYI